MLRDLGPKRKGKKPRKFGQLAVLSTFAAAVTVLKKGRTVDATIAEIATPSGLSRKDIKNFRDRINRGLVHDGSEVNYKMMVIWFQRIPRTEIMETLSYVAKRFCT